MLKETEERTAASTGMVLVAVSAAKAINPMFIPVEPTATKTGFFCGAVLTPDSGGTEVTLASEVLEYIANETANIRTGEGAVLVRFRTADAEVTVDGGAEVALAAEVPEGISANNCVLRTTAIKALEYIETETGKGAVFPCSTPPG